MSNPAAQQGRHQGHQHPLIFISIFLVIAFGALLLIVANNQPEQAESAPPVPTTPTATDCPQGEPEGFELSDVEGKPLSEVEQWAAGEDMSVRVVQEDGRPNAVTMDYRTDRVNVQVEAGTVTRYCGNY